VEDAHCQLRDKWLCPTLNPAAVQNKVKTGRKQYWVDLFPLIL